MDFEASCACSSAVAAAAAAAGGEFVEIEGEEPWRRDAAVWSCAFWRSRAASWDFYSKRRKKRNGLVVEMLGETEGRKRYTYQFLNLAVRSAGLLAIHIRLSQLGQFLFGLSPLLI